MKDEEAKNHPHLLMLDEFDGEIDGELKVPKVLYKYRVNALEEEDWGFTRSGGARLIRASRRLCSHWMI